MPFAFVKGLWLGEGSCVQLLMSGWTKVLPAPLRVVLARAAPAAVTAMVARTATAATATEILTDMPFFGIEFSSSWIVLGFAANIRLAVDRVGNARVAE